MFVKQFLTGGDRNFGYLAADEATKLSVVIDPSFNPKMIIDYAKEKNYRIEYIFVTHNHSDHTNGNEKIHELTGIRSLLFKDLDAKSGKKVLDGEQFLLGEVSIEILHTPGHTSDSICIYVGDVVFTGDTLFVGKVGGTDLGENARIEYNSLHNRLLKLPDSTCVFPGHNYGVAPESTILQEKQTNPFLLQPNIEAFIELKRNWAEYKKIHGIA